MKNLNFSYAPNKNYAEHHAQVRNKVNNAFKKNYDLLNDKVRIIMSENAKIEKGKQGYLKDKKSKNDIESLCNELYNDFKEMKNDFERNALPKNKYLSSLIVLKTMIDTIRNINPHALREVEILQECHRQGLIK